MAHLGSPGNNYKNKVPGENIIRGTLFPTVISRGT
jgi:hypothetical protein